jgi:hypothetical protein
MREHRGSGECKTRVRACFVLGGALAAGVLVGCAVDGVTAPGAPGVQEVAEPADLEASAFLGRIGGGDPLARILRFREELALTPEQVAELEGLRSRFLETNRAGLERLRSVAPPVRGVRPAPLRERIRREFPQAEARLRGMDPADRAEALERLRERFRDGRGPGPQARDQDPERLQAMRERLQERRSEMLERRELMRERQAALAAVRQELAAAQARLREEVRRVLTPEQLERLNALPDRPGVGPTRTRPGPLRP